MVIHSLNVLTQEAGKVDLYESKGQPGLQKQTKVQDWGRGGDSEGVSSC